MHPMKISCLRSDLATAISNVSRAVSTKASIPALEGVLIKAYGNTLNISGYNLEIGITTDIEATIKEEGEIVVSAKLFLDIVRRLPEEIVFIETDERMVTYIACGKVNYQIVGMSSVEYPDLPSFEQTDRITLNAKILRDMIRQTVYAVSENTAKPIYTGSLYEIEDGVFMRVLFPIGFWSTNSTCLMLFQSPSIDVYSPGASATRSRRRRMAG